MKQGGRGGGQSVRIPEKRELKVYWKCSKRGRDVKFSTEREAVGKKQNKNKRSAPSLFAFLPRRQVGVK